MSQLKDETGKTYGRLVVTGPCRLPKEGHAGWVCRCACGNTVQVVGQHLRSGRTRSCGCLHIEAARQRCVARAIHGQTTGSNVGRPTRTYNSWTYMKSRCYNPRDSHYSHYGGAGITVCQAWMTFTNFLADMGERPANMTLDRFPNNKGLYEPGNCRWATLSQQRCNQMRYKPKRQLAA